jgi:redox-sensitive bicupin YhaK (pirin superfamily)
MVHTFQLWVNMPAAAKFAEPRYQDLRHDEMPAVHLDGVDITVYSGSSHGSRANTRNHTPFTYVEIDLSAGASVTERLPDSYNGFVHVVRGKGRIGADETLAKEAQTLWLERSEAATDTTITITAETAMRVLVVAGKPLGEPVVTGGPFVMNTAEQITEAYADYRAGRFGPAL